MTNELEKQFFDTFGIEKLLSQRYHTSIYGSIENCIEKAKEWSKETGIRIKNLEIASDESIYFDKVYYPQITDSILLELVCILLSNNSPYMFKLGDWNVEKLKDTVLTMCIKLPDFLEWEDTSEYFKHQVRTLFEEG